MKTFAFVISGALLAWIVPVVMAATVMMLASPRVSRNAEARVMWLLAVEGAVPLIWIVSCVMCILESRERNRPAYTRAYVLAPYVTMAIFGVGAYLIA